MLIGKPFNYIIHDSFADSFNFDELTRIKNSGEQRIDISLEE